MKERPSTTSSSFVLTVVPPSTRSGAPQPQPVTIAASAAAGRRIEVLRMVLAAVEAGATRAEPPHFGRSGGPVRALLLFGACSLMGAYPV